MTRAIARAALAGARGPLPSEPLLDLDLRRFGDGAALRAAGDLDADGYGDLVGVPRGRDEVWLYRGSAAGVADAYEVISDARWRDVEAARAAGDVDGDGYDDVVAGVPSRDRADVFHGGAGVFERVEALQGREGSEFGRAL